MKVFYCCPCRKCAGEDKTASENHKVFLPYEVEGLGKYTRRRGSAIGVYKYEKPYIPEKFALAPESAIAESSPLADTIEALEKEKLYQKEKEKFRSKWARPAWPARFACFRCKIQDSCEGPRGEEFDRERLSIVINGQSLWRIEIEDEDERYRKAPMVKDTLYTRANTKTSEEEFVLFLNKLGWYPKPLNPERVHVHSFPYEF